MRNKQQCCRNCDFMLRKGTDFTQGSCRRNPPQMSFVATPAGVQQIAAFPIVTLKDEGCAEFRPVVVVEGGTMHDDRGEEEASSVD